MEYMRIIYDDEYSEQVRLIKYFFESVGTLVNAIPTSGIDSSIIETLNSIKIDSISEDERKYFKNFLKNAHFDLKVFLVKDKEIIEECKENEKLVLPLEIKDKYDHIRAIIEKCVALNGIYSDSKEKKELNDCLEIFERNNFDELLYLNELDMKIKNEETIDKINKIYDKMVSELNKLVKENYNKPSGNFYCGFMMWYAYCQEIFFNTKKVNANIPYDYEAIYKKLEEFQDNHVREKAITALLLPLTITDRKYNRGYKVLYKTETISDIIPTKNFQGEYWLNFAEDPEKAARHYYELLLAHPYYYEAWLNLGRCYVKINTQTAKRCFMVATRLLDKKLITNTLDYSEYFHLIKAHYLTYNVIDEKKYDERLDCLEKIKKLLMKIDKNNKLEELSIIDKEEALEIKNSQTGKIPNIELQLRKLKTSI